MDAAKVAAIAGSILGVLFVLLRRKTRDREA